MAQETKPIPDIAMTATRNGMQGVDGTNNRFVYYSGGNRYYLTGTAF